MANPSDTSEASASTSTAEAAPSKASKRKTRKAPIKSSAAKPAAPSGPSEILFKELPNPYQTPEPPFIWIDFPQQSERLFEATYVVRLGVGGAEQVEISIDNGPWLDCRLTSGYRWFDWNGIEPGKHTLVARMRTSDGRVFRTPARACEYRP